MYRDTNVADFVQASSLHWVEVVDDGGLRQGVRASGGGFKTLKQRLEHGQHKVTR